MKYAMIERVNLLWKRIKCRIYTLGLSRAFYKIGWGTIINPPFRYKNLMFVQLGQAVVIQRNCWIQTVIQDAPGNEGPLIFIGDNSAIGMDATISAAKKIVIGNNVLLARNVYITDHEHKYESTEAPIMDQGITKVSEVSIGDNTWLCQNVVILPGVSIGKNCVVGANSVVNKSIPDYCVAVGSPAKVVKIFDHRSNSWRRGSIQ
jgi:acetyltransferase-like isoleucine patch superfamily enzyme